MDFRFPSVPILTVLVMLYGTRFTLVNMKGICIDISIRAQLWKDLHLMEGSQTEGEDPPRPAS